MSGRRINVITGEETIVTDDIPVVEPPIPQNTLRRMVRRETNRRIVEATPDTFAYFVSWLELYKLNPNPTPQQDTKAQQIRAGMQKIVDIRDAGRAILQMDPIPEDFDDDARWP